MVDLSQLYQNNQAEAEKVHFSDADFDQDFRVDPLTTMESINQRFKDQEQKAKERIEELKKLKAESDSIAAKTREEEQYKKFKERHQNEQETALKSHKDEHG
jgi:hypothetical protein